MATKRSGKRPRPPGPGDPIAPADFVLALTAIAVFRRVVVGLDVGLEGLFELGAVSFELLPFALQRLLELERQGRVRVSDVVRDDSPGDLLEHALSLWNGYHDSTAASLEGGRVVLRDPALLLYYQNRLVSFAEEIATPEQLPAACEIEKLGAHR